MYSAVNENDFSAWLQKEIDSRGWNYSELARQAEVSRGAISNLFNDYRQPGWELCSSIAAALGLPTEFVLRKAGLLPPLNNPREVAEHILDYKLSELSEEQLDDVLAYIEFIQSRPKRGRDNRYEVTRREGETTPPEVVKD